MAMANTVDLVTAAQNGGYAVPAVNIVDDLSARAVVRAAEAAQSPIILQTSVKTVRSVGLTLLAAIARSAAQSVRVPVALHLDHCPDREVITQVIGAGWTSVLFDASDRSLEQARKETAEVVAEAHEAGVGVESEIENIIGVEDGVGSDEAKHSYSVGQLVEVAHETGTDMIAPQLGTAHGLYSAAPVLQFHRVESLRALTDLPVVLHGGTGLAASDFRRFIGAGISKINISTALKIAYMKAARTHLATAEATGKWEPVKMFDQISAAVTAVTLEHIDLFGSRGAATAKAVSA
ncbi:ketose-bisphosphate aldolase [Streptomyces sp. NPDC013157]|uniref:class II fructose-bisphosphate aldolase n=1 Tax=Streptomyces sp. NPDC013157 TaxID=3364861 RepID=UPI0036C995D6